MRGRLASWDFAFLENLPRLLRAHEGSWSIRANPLLGESIFPILAGFTRVHRVHGNGIWTQKTMIFCVFCKKKLPSDTKTSGFFLNGSFHEKIDFACWHESHILFSLQNIFRFRYFHLSLEEADENRLCSHVFLTFFSAYILCVCDTVVFGTLVFTLVNFTKKRYFNHNSFVWIQRFSLDGLGVVVYPSVWALHETPVQRCVTSTSPS